MKHTKLLGLLASVFLLTISAAPAGAADQYGGSGYQRSDDAMESTTPSDSMQGQNQGRMMRQRDRRAQDSRQSGLVECKDSLKCQQKNPNWEDLQQSGGKPLMVDPATGSPPKK